MSWALVTGGAAGIGRAIARRLVEAGWPVAVLDLDGAGLERLQAELGCATFECDVGDPVAVRATLEQLPGPVSVLVNNAGRGGPFHRVDEVSDEEWTGLFDTNVRSVFSLCRGLLPAMREAGFGRVVNIASVQGLRGAARSSTYVACKHAVVGYTRALAAEWGPFGVTVNAICPGYVRTGMGIPATATEEARAALLAGIPVGRDADPDEIAATVLHLIGPESGYVNGAALVMDGGASIVM